MTTAKIFLIEKFYFTRGEWQRGDDRGYYGIYYFKLKQNNLSNEKC